MNGLDGKRVQIPRCRATVRRPGESCRVRSWATVPPVPGGFNPTSPSSGATDQPVGGSLSWQPSSDATGYDVYLDGNNPPSTLVSTNQSGTNYSYGGLSNSSVYYWKVVAKNAGGSTPGTGSPWSFTTIVATPGAFKGFKDGTLNAMASRYSVGSTPGASFNYGVFGGYLVISTSYDGLKAVAPMLGL